MVRLVSQDWVLWVSRFFSLLAQLLALCICSRFIAYTYSDFTIMLTTVQRADGCQHHADRIVFQKSCCCCCCCATILPLYVLSHKTPRRGEDSQPTNTNYKQLNVNVCKRSILQATNQENRDVLEKSASFKSSPDDVG